MMAVVVVVVVVTADDCVRALARGAERAVVNGSDPLGWVPRGSAREREGSPGHLPFPRVAPPREIGGEMGVRFAPPAVPESGVLAARCGASVGERSVRVRERVGSRGGGTRRAGWLGE